MAYIMKHVEVDINEFSDDELIDELVARGHNILGKEKEYDLDLFEDSQLIDAVKRLGYRVISGESTPKETLEYILSVIPEEKIGSEGYFHQEAIRRTYLGWSE